RLALHDVTPVARGVADAQEHGPILRSRAREGLVAPRKPIDGIVRVLAQIGAGLVREAVRHGSGACWPSCPAVSVLPYPSPRFRSALSSSTSAVRSCSAS